MKFSLMSCSAVCECSERFDANGSALGMWYGDDCSLDDVGFAEVVSLRNHLLGSLGTVTGMQDITSDALNQQASSLSSLVADPSQLAGGGELQALALVGGLPEEERTFRDTCVATRVFESELRNRRHRPPFLVGSPLRDREHRSRHTTHDA